MQRKKTEVRLKDSFDANGHQTYVVDTLINRVEPCIGKHLNKRDVEVLIDERDTKVVITA